MEKIERELTNMYVELPVIEWHEAFLKGAATMEKEDIEPIKSSLVEEMQFGGKVSREVQMYPPIVSVGYTHNEFLTRSDFLLNAIMLVQSIQCRPEGHGVSRNGYFRHGPG